MIIIQTPVQGNTNSDRKTTGMVVDRKEDKLIVVES